MVDGVVGIIGQAWRKVGLERGRMRGEVAGLEVFTGVGAVC